MRTVNGVDAISGATIAQVKEAVVSGALYSCYTAWHLVHGDIQEQLKTHTQATLTHEMTQHMLHSINADYQLFALDQMELKDYHAHYQQIAHIFKTGTPLVRSVIAKRLTSKFKDTPQLQRPFWEAFEQVDSSSRSLMMNYLNQAPDYVAQVLSQKLGVMSKNQLKDFLHTLASKRVIPAEIHTNLLEFARSEHQTYAYVAQEFLDELP